MLNICIYCGGNSGNHAAYESAAVELGEAIAKAGHHIIYGGGSNGLMGAVSNSALSHGGKVTGIIPKFLSAKELANNNASQLILTESMGERKLLLSEKADVFVILPGGIGTLDELFETMALFSLRQHEKPMFLLNTENYWKPLLKLLEHVKEKGFAYSALPQLETSQSVTDLMKLINKHG